jgi:hypothetical protein
MLAFNGNSGVGKDTLAARIMGEHSQPWPLYHLKFAIPLRAVFYCLHGYPQHLIGDPQFEHSLGIKDKLVAFNGEYRSISPDMCLHGLGATIQLFYPGCAGILITDMRQPNELAWVMAMGGTGIRLEREGHTQPPRAMDNLLHNLEEHWITSSSSSLLAGRIHPHKPQVEGSEGLFLQDLSALRRAGMPLDAEDILLSMAGYAKNLQAY